MRSSGWKIWKTRTLCADLDKVLVDQVLVGLERSVRNQGAYQDHNDVSDHALWRFIFFHHQAGQGEEADDGKERPDKSQSDKNTD